ncbi:enoyl-CoA hydratase/isomerase family protein [Alcaligenaceae bacterium CGII-47]|nr:enoyl-CoA hydratase/isomerase family protein [Alcaligenaceae bacterium CGII-47]
MSDFVQTRRVGNVLVITIQNPPVNALSHAVRLGLTTAVAAAREDTLVQAVVLASSGTLFIGGADIREFGQPRQPPLLSQVCDEIEALNKPVVAAVHGPALGGGMEVALAAHFRVGGPQAQFALPEVLLGLMPGAGGTQRTPRLIGAKAALDLMLTGRRIEAARARELGLVDRLADDPLETAIIWAQALADQGAAPRRTCDGHGLDDIQASAAAIQAARIEVQRKHSQLFSPARIVDAVAAALEQPFEACIRLESELFLQCLDSPQRLGLVHAFFAEREALKVPEAAADAPRRLERIGVIGGGTMGAGIAVSLLDAGLQVILVERDEASLARGRATVEKVYEGLVAKHRLSPEACAGRLAQLEGAVGYGALADADLVIEAVFEDMAVKKAVFTELATICKPGAVLATNTSYLDVDVIAASSGRASDVIGLHFFSPANVMKLLEVVVPRQAAADAVATGFALAKRLRKVAVRAGVCDGFIGNRILACYRRAAEYMVEDGASPYEVDAALRGFGFPMGLFQVMDLAGGDIAWAARKRRAATRPADERYVHISDRLCERGWFGQKTQRGWYRYADGDRHGQPDPEVLAIIAQERRRAGVTPRVFSAQEIVQRYLGAMINEGANVVLEGIALRPLDVDVVLVNGYGFPRYRGGPLLYADQVGLPVLLERMQAWAVEDAQFWRPSELLLDLAHRGESFASLNRRGDKR